MSIEEYHRISIESSGASNASDSSPSDDIYIEPKQTFQFNTLKDKHFGHISRTYNASLSHVRKSRHTKRVLWSLVLLILSCLAIMYASLLSLSAILSKNNS